MKKTIFILSSNPKGTSVLDLDFEKRVAIAFRRNGKYLVSGSNDRTVGDTFQA